MEPECIISDVKSKNVPNNKNDNKSHRSDKELGCTNVCETSSKSVPFYTLEDDSKFRSSIVDMTTKLDEFKSFCDKIHTYLKSFENTRDYSKWRLQIIALQNIIETEYRQKIPNFEEMLSLLKISYDFLMEPIFQKRYILIGQTKAGKSNLGNALLSCRHFKTSSGFGSETKDHSVGSITESGYTNEFIDTQGLNDTTGEDSLAKLIELISSIKWQYHGVLYVVKYSNLELENIQKIIAHLKSIFGTSKVLEKTILVFTSSPMSMTYKSFADCRKRIEKDEKKFKDKTVLDLLKSFKAVKFVNLEEIESEEETSDNEEDRKQYKENREKEAKIFRNDLKNLDLPLSDPKPLRDDVLQRIKQAVENFASLLALQKKIEEFAEIIRQQKVLSFYFEKLIGLFTEKDVNFRVLLEI